jgi:hypothetical protein
MSEAQISTNSNQPISFYSDDKIAELGNNIKIYNNFINDLTNNYYNLINAIPTPTPTDYIVKSDSTSTSTSTSSKIRN